MVSREQRFRLRIFLLISVLILVIILALFLFPGFEKAVERYHINFKKMSVSGLNEGATVRYQGVDIGNVTRIKVNSEDLSSIRVDVEIEKSFPVKKDMRAALAYLGISGMKFIELSGGENQSENLPPLGIIPTQKGLGEKAEDIVSNIDQAIKGVNRLLSQDNLDKIALSLENIEKTSHTINTVMDRKKQELIDSITNLERATRVLRNVADRLNDAIDKMGLEQIGESGRLAVENISRRFSDKELGQVLKQIDEFVGSANETIRRLNQMIINQQESMGKSFTRLAEVFDNLSKLSRILLEDPTMLVRKKTPKRSKK